MREINLKEILIKNITLFTGYMYTSCQEEFEKKYGVEIIEAYKLFWNNLNICFTYRKKQFEKFSLDELIEIAKDVLDGIGYCKRKWDESDEEINYKVGVCIGKIELIIDLYTNQNGKGKR